jgi:hypothetical protein
VIFRSRLGFLGPGSSRHHFSTRRWYPQCEQGDTQDKLHQPGFYRCGERRTIMWPTGLLPVWPRNCSRKVMPGRVRKPGITVTATTLPANKIVLKDFLIKMPTSQFVRVMPDFRAIVFVEGQLPVIVAIPLRRRNSAFDGQCWSCFHI